MNKLFQHLLCQHRKFIAEPSSRDLDPVTCIPEVETKFSKIGIVDIFGNRVGKEVAEQAGEDSVPRSDVKNRTICNVNAKSF